jgi:hypothetical protein
LPDIQTDQRSQPPKKRGRLRRALMLTLFILVGYGLIAYLVLPGFWTHYEHQRGLADMPMVTRTGQDIPGDPMNVGLVGDVADVVCAMHAAGRSDHAEILDRDRRQRAARPAVQGRAGQQSLLPRPPRGSRL